MISNLAPSVAFVPHNAYHAREMAAIAEEFTRRGKDILFVDITPKFGKDEGARAVIDELQLPVVDIRSDWMTRTTPRAMLVMNDWTQPVRSLVVDAKAQGILTFGLVEGSQDFKDSHVEHLGIGYYRKPYLRVHVPLLIGEYCRRFFRSRPAHVVGLPRVERIARDLGPAAPPLDQRPPLVAINLNFSYGLYTEVQEMWLEQVVGACQRAGFPFVITKHHANQLDCGYLPVANEPLYEVLARSTVVVSRFSSVIYEAMGFGLPIVYHNPHGERVDTFQCSFGGYPTTNDEAELAAALTRVSRNFGEFEAGYRRFFSHHVSIDLQRTSTERIRSVIAQCI